VNDILGLLEKRNKILQQFLEITTLISNCLSALETIEELREVEKLVDQRSELIEKAGEIAEAIKQCEVDEDMGSSEIEEQRRRMSQLLQDAQKLEKENVSKMDLLMKDYMKKVRTTKESIRVIDAYKLTSSEDFTSSFNKTK